MKTFPENIQFEFPWRPYQEEILKELESHLDDRHLHIVAAPGSGKTILGLEVMLRINTPTLILAPSIAIRNQWVERFTEHFLQMNKIPDWVSFDIKNPEFLTVSTYQGLHAAFTNQDEMTEDLIEEESDEVEDTKKKITSVAKKTLQKLQEKGIETIIIDEAHHLRNAWWKSLMHLKKNLEKKHIVALTATPPYDVEPGEWKNYQNLAGPIDAEISIPELVAAKNLCPHQDFVYLNTLSLAERKIVSDFRKQVKKYLKEFTQNNVFISLLENHPCVVEPEKHIESILKNPEYFSSILFYLHASSRKLPRGLLKVLGKSKRQILKFTAEWAEILLNNVLYHDDFLEEQYKEELKQIRKGLKDIGAIEKRNVFLIDTPQIKQLLKTSINKLNSIIKIVEFEHEKLQKDLRMVILTDYIRKEFLPKKEEKEKALSRIGVIPIFEKIRREYLDTRKIAVLSGSIVIIPKTAKEALILAAKEEHITQSHIKCKPFSFDKDFLEVKIVGESNKKKVHLITEIFGKGEIEILVGTKSLLGEGWDAPSINTLVLASFVGSFMLSNQMRGRAIRIDTNKKQKVSNIWHLASVEVNNSYAGHDFSMLKRRFKSFVGLSHHEEFIENGFDRMHISSSPYNELKIQKINYFTFLSAKNRKNIALRWQQVLENGEVKKIVQELETPKVNLPRNFIFGNTIFAIFWRASVLGLTVFSQFSEAVAEKPTIEMITMILGISLLVSLPGLLKALYLFVRNGPIAGNMRQVGLALLKTLYKMNVIKTDVNKLRVIAKKGAVGKMSCGLEGGTSYEKSVFLDCLEEVLSPIENPRYLLLRKSKWNIFLRKDFHVVPEIIGRNKKNVKFFSLMWGKHVGQNSFMYTRSIRGRRLLLEARQKALSQSFKKESKRVNTWK